MAENAVSVAVGLRVRPLTEDESLKNNLPLGLQPDRQNKQVKLSAVVNEKVFLFDHVFDAESSQTSVYEEAVAPLLHKTLDGWSSCVLAYGQTGSGKTYTMGTGQLDVEEERWGIAPRMLKEVFRSIKERKTICEDEVTVSVSFLEIYNEDVYDLLSAQNGRTPIPIRENASGIKLPNLRQVEVSSFKEAMSFLREGVEARTTSSTSMNVYSSRSHAIFNMEIQRKTRNMLFTSKLRVVDLAGSEAVHRTSVQSTTFREGININKSLLALANMIEALNQDKAYIPYRDSILTRLLQESLGGNCCTILIACVCPTLTHSTETITTMRFAERIRGIKTKPSMVFSCYGSARKRPIAPNPVKTESLKECKKFTSLFATPIPRTTSELAAQQDEETKTRRCSPRFTASSVQTLGVEHLVQAEKDDNNLLSYSSPAESSVKSSNGLAVAQHDSISVTPLVLRVAQRVEQQLAAHFEKMATRMEERFRECVEESFSSHPVFATLDSPPSPEAKNSTLQKEELFFKVPSSVTVRERQQNSICPSTPELFKRPRCSILPVCEKENLCKCNAFYSDPMGSPHHATFSRSRRRTSFRKSIAQIMPSPQRGWKIQVDPQVLERSNHHLMTTLNTGSKAKLQLLPCIGPKTAHVIATWREIHGPFQSVQDLLQIEGLTKSFYKRFVKFRLLCGDGSMNASARAISPTYLRAACSIDLWQDGTGRTE